MMSESINAVVNLIAGDRSVTLLEIENEMKDAGEEFRRALQEHKETFE